MLNLKNSSNSPFSEVIESSLYTWLIQSWQWDATPAFGSLVTIESNKKVLCGIVHQIQTGSMDPIRYPFPYKKTHEELRAEQPQIFEFLKTTFSCIPIGYFDKGKMVYLLPPEPPLIHSFASLMSADMQKQFFYKDTYLQVLFGLSAHLANIDELLLALLKQQADLGLLSVEKIHRFMGEYSLLIGNDYRRLKLILQRVETILDHQ